MSISLLRRLLMKEAVKDTAGFTFYKKGTPYSSGIMTINKNIRNKVEKQLQKYINDAMQQGVDLDTLSPEQLKMIVQMNKPQPPRVIAADSPEGRGITERLFGKQGEVVDMAGKKLDTSQGIMGGKSVKELMDSGQVSKGARGMKKSKKVQDREMFQGANKRLKTEAQLKAEMEASNKKAVSNIKKKNRESMPIRLMKNFEKELNQTDLMAEGYSKDQANVLIKARKKMTSGEEINPNESLLRVKEEFADNAGVDVDDFTDIDFEIDVPEYATGGRIGLKDGEGVITVDDKIDEMISFYKDYLNQGGKMDFKTFSKKYIPENFADGGVAGLLGERPGYRSAGFISGRTKSSKSRSSTNQGPAGGASAGGNYGGNKNPNQTYGGGGGGNNNTGGGGGGGPPGTNTGDGTTTTPTTPTTTQPSFRELIRQKQILDYLNSLEEEDLALGAGPLGSILKKGALKKGPFKMDDKGIGLEFLKKYNYLGDSNFKFNLDTEYKDLLKGKIKPKAEFERNIGDFKLKGDIDTDKNIGLKLTMPTNLFNKPKSKTRNFQDRFAPDISKFNFGDMTGITSQAPTNMQLAMITDTQKDLIDKQGKMGQLTGAFDPNATFNAAKMFDDKGSSGVFGIGAREAEPMTREEFDAYISEKGYADGGPARQNFAMGKRAFLKMLAGAGAGIAGLKSGLIGFGGKEATKKAVTETVKSAGSGTPPPYFFRLVEKIKFMGDDTLATTDKAIAKKYKDYTMEEDFAGNIEIIKKGDNVAEDVYISYKVDDVPLRGKKGSKRIEEYEEYTARPDAEGKMKDIEQGVPDEVIDEAGDTTAMTLKRASGGIARMLGE